MNKFDQQSFARQTIIRIGGLNSYVTGDNVRDHFITFGPIVRVLVPLEEKSTSTTNSSTSTTNSSTSTTNTSNNTPTNNTNNNQTDTTNQSTISRNRGFALVEYQYPEDAEQAIKNMNDAELFGRTLTVALAQSNAQKGSSKWDIIDNINNTEMKDE